MVLLEDKIYEETKKLALGEKEYSPIAMELSKYLLDKFSVKMLNFQFSLLEHTKGKRYRLYIILKGTEDYKKMYIESFTPNPKTQMQIAMEFSRLAQKYNYTDTSKLTDLFVIYNDFSEEAKTEANWKAIKKASEILIQKYKDVSLWHIDAEFSSAVVFYLTDADILKNEENGTSTKIKVDYFEILKKYDELDYYTLDNFIVTYDSKENLDQNYEGNLFYYSRR